MPTRRHAVARAALEGRARDPVPLDAPERAAVTARGCHAAVMQQLNGTPRPRVRGGEAVFFRGVGGASCWNRTSDPHRVKVVFYR
jgi:hypothetical protein